MGGGVFTDKHTNTHTHTEINTLKSQLMLAIKSEQARIILQIEELQMDHHLRVVLVFNSLLRKDRQSENSLVN